MDKDKPQIEVDEQNPDTRAGWRQALGPNIPATAVEAASSPVPGFAKKWGKAEVGDSADAANIRDSELLDQTSLENALASAGEVETQRALAKRLASAALEKCDNDFQAASKRLQSMRLDMREASDAKTSGLFRGQIETFFRRAMAYLMNEARSLVRKHGKEQRGESMRGRLWEVSTEVSRVLAAERDELAAQIKDQGATGKYQGFAAGDGVASPQGRARKGTTFLPATSTGSAAGAGSRGAEVVSAGGGDSGGDGGGDGADDEAEHEEDDSKRFEKTGSYIATLPEVAEWILPHRTDKGWLMNILFEQLHKEQVANRFPLTGADLTFIAIRQKTAEIRLTIEGVAGRSVGWRLHTTIQNKEDTWQCADTEIVIPEETFKDGIGIDQIYQSLRGRSRQSIDWLLVHSEEFHIGVAQGEPYPYEVVGLLEPRLRDTRPYAEQYTDLNPDVELTSDLKAEFIRQGLRERAGSLRGMIVRDSIDLEQLGNMEASKLYRLFGDGRSYARRMFEFLLHGTGYSDALYSITAQDVGEERYGQLADVLGEILELMPEGDEAYPDLSKVRNFIEQAITKLRQADANMKAEREERDTKRVALMGGLGIDDTQQFDRVVALSRSVLGDGFDVFGGQISASDMLVLEHVATLIRAGKSDDSILGTLNQGISMLADAMIEDPGTLRALIRILGELLSDGAKNPLSANFNDGDRYLLKLAVNEYASDPDESDLAERVKNRLKLERGDHLFLPVTALDGMPDFIHLVTHSTFVINKDEVDPKELAEQLQTAAGEIGASVLFEFVRVSDNSLTLLVHERRSIASGGRSEAGKILATVDFVFDPSSSTLKLRNPAERNAMRYPVDQAAELLGYAPEDLKQQLAPFMSYLDQGSAFDEPVLTNRDLLLLSVLISAAPNSDSAELMHSIHESERYELEIRTYADQGASLFLQQLRTRGVISNFEPTIELSSQTQDFSDHLRQIGVDPESFNASVWTDTTRSRLYFELSTSGDRTIVLHGRVLKDSRGEWTVSWDPTEIAKRPEATGRKALAFELTSGNVEKLDEIIIIVKPWLSPEFNPEETISASDRAVLARAAKIRSHVGGTDDIIQAFFEANSNESRVVHLEGRDLEDMATILGNILDARQAFSPIGLTFFLPPFAQARQRLTYSTPPLPHNAAFNADFDIDLSEPQVEFTLVSVQPEGEWRWTGKLVRKDGQNIWTVSEDQLVAPMDVILPLSAAPAGGSGGGSAGGRSGGGDGPSDGGQSPFDDTGDADFEKQKAAFAQALGARRTELQAELRGLNWTNVEVTFGNAPVRGDLVWRDGKAWLVYPAGPSTVSMELTDEVLSTANFDNAKWTIPPQWKNIQSEQDIRDGLHSAIPSLDTCFEIARKVFNLEGQFITLERWADQSEIILGALPAESAYDPYRQVLEGIIRAVGTEISESTPAGETQSATELAAEMGIDEARLIELATLIATLLSPRSQDSTNPRFTHADARLLGVAQQWDKSGLEKDKFLSMTEECRVTPTHQVIWTPKGVDGIVRAIDICTAVTFSERPALDKASLEKQISSRIQEEFRFYVTEEECRIEVALMEADLIIRVSEFSGQSSDVKVSFRLTFDEATKAWVLNSFDNALSAEEVFDMEDAARSLIAVENEVPRDSWKTAEGARTAAQAFVEFCNSDLKIEADLLKKIEPALYQVFAYIQLSGRSPQTIGIERQYESYVLFEKGKNGEHDFSYTFDASGKVSRAVTQGKLRPTWRSIFEQRVINDSERNHPALRTWLSSAIGTRLTGDAKVSFLTRALEALAKADIWKQNNQWLASGLFVHPKSIEISFSDSDRAATITFTNKNGEGKSVVVALDDLYIEQVADQEQRKIARQPISNVAQELAVFINRGRDRQKIVDAKKLLKELLSLLHQYAPSQGPYDEDRVVAASIERVANEVQFELSIPPLPGTRSGVVLRAQVLLQGEPPELQLVSSPTDVHRNDSQISLSSSEGIAELVKDPTGIQPGTSAGRMIAKHLERALGKHGTGGVYTLDRSGDNLTISRDAKDGQSTAGTVKFDLSGDTPTLLSEEIPLPPNVSESQGLTFSMVEALDKQLQLDGAKPSHRVAIINRVRAAFLWNKELRAASERTKDDPDTAPKLTIDMRGSAAGRYSITIVWKDGNGVPDDHKEDLIVDGIGGKIARTAGETGLRLRHLFFSSIGEGEERTRLLSSKETRKAWSVLGLLGLEVAGAVAIANTPWDPVHHDLSDTGGGQTNEANDDSPSGLSHTFEQIGDKIGAEWQEGPVDLLTIPGDRLDSARLYTLEGNSELIDYLGSTGYAFAFDQVEPDENIGGLKYVHLDLRRGSDKSPVDLYWVQDLVWKSGQHVTMSPDGNFFAPDGAQLSMTELLDQYGDKLEGPALATMRDAVAVQEIPAPTIEATAEPAAAPTAEPTVTPEPIAEATTEAGDPTTIAFLTTLNEALGAENIESLNTEAFVGGITELFELVDQDGSLGLGMNDIEDVIFLEPGEWNSKLDEQGLGKVDVIIEINDGSVDISLYRADGAIDVNISIGDKGSIKAVDDDIRTSGEGTGEVEIQMDWTLHDLAAEFGLDVSGRLRASMIKQALLGNIDALVEFQWDQLLNDDANDGIDRQPMLADMAAMFELDTEDGITAAKAWLKQILEDNHSNIVVQRDGDRVSFTLINLPATEFSKLEAEGLLEEGSARPIPTSEPTSPLPTSTPAASPSALPTPAPTSAPSPTNTLTSPATATAADPTATPMSPAASAIAASGVQTETQAAASPMTEASQWEAFYQQFGARATDMPAEQRTEAMRLLDDWIARLEKALTNQELTKEQIATLESWQYAAEQTRSAAANAPVLAEEIATLAPVQETQAEAPVATETPAPAVETATRPIIDLSDGLNTADITINIARAQNGELLIGQGAGLPDLPLDVYELPAFTESQVLDAVANSIAKEIGEIKNSGSSEIDWSQITSIKLNALVFGVSPSSEPYFEVWYQLTDSDGNEYKSIGVAVLDIPELPPEGSSDGLDIAGLTSALDSILVDRPYSHKFEAGQSIHEVVDSLLQRILSDAGVEASAINPTVLADFEYRLTMASAQAINLAIQKGEPILDSGGLLQFNTADLAEFHTTVRLSRLETAPERIEFAVSARLTTDPTNNSVAHQGESRIVLSPTLDVEQQAIAQLETDAFRWLNEADLWIKDSSSLIEHAPTMMANLNNENPSSDDVSKAYDAAAKMAESETSMLSRRQSIDVAIARLESIDGDRETVTELRAASDSMGNLIDQLHVAVTDIESALDTLIQYKIVEVELATEAADAASIAAETATEAANKDSSQANINSARAAQEVARSAGEALKAVLDNFVATIEAAEAKDGDYPDGIPVYNAANTSYPRALAAGGVTLPEPNDAPAVPDPEVSHDALNAEVDSVIAAASTLLAEVYDPLHATELAETALADGVTVEEITTAEATKKPLYDAVNDVEIMISKLTDLRSRLQGESGVDNSTTITTVDDKIKDLRDEQTRLNYFAEHIESVTDAMLAKQVVIALERGQEATSSATAAEKAAQTANSNSTQENVASAQTAQLTSAAAAQAARAEQQIMVDLAAAAGEQDDPSVLDASSLVEAKATKAEAAATAALPLVTTEISPPEPPEIVRTNAEIGSWEKIDVLKNWQHQIRDLGPNQSLEDYVVDLINQDETVAHLLGTIAISGVWGLNNYGVPDNSHDDHFDIVVFTTAPDGTIQEYSISIPRKEAPQLVFAPLIQSAPLASADAAAPETVNGISLEPTTVESSYEYEIPRGEGPWLGIVAAAKQFGIGINPLKSALKHLMTGDFDGTFPLVFTGDDFRVDHNTNDTYTVAFTTGQGQNQIAYEGTYLIDGIDVEYLGDGADAAAPSVAEVAAPASLPTAEAEEAQPEIEVRSIIKDGDSIWENTQEMSQRLNVHWDSISNAFVDLNVDQNDGRLVHPGDELLMSQDADGVVTLTLIIKRGNVILSDSYTIEDHRLVLER